MLTAKIYTKLDALCSQYYFVHELFQLGIVLLDKHTRCGLAMEVADSVTVLFWLACYDFRLLADNSLYSCSVLSTLSIVNSVGNDQR